MIESLLTQTDNLAILILLCCVAGLGWYVLSLQKFINTLVDKYADLSRESTAANIELATLLKGFISR